jgi:hypothetical protein
LAVGAAVVTKAETQLHCCCADVLEDVLRAASAAADRSGNERAVRVSKMSAYVKRGTQHHKNMVRLCDAWLAWSFQDNFKFEPIL